MNKSKDTTKDIRKNIKATTSVKLELQSVHEELKKTSINMKTENNVIAYLLAMYKGQKKSISLADHNRYLKEAEEINNQLSL